jgi:hypothetical protein
MILTNSLLGTLFCAAAAFAAMAQTATDRYIEVRNHAIEESKAPYEALNEQQRKKLDILQGLLRQAVGPFSNPSVEGDGTINLESLAPEADFGRLDGLVYKSHDGNTEILVTTRSLVDDWLRQFYDRPTGVRRDLAGVLASEAQSLIGSGAGSRKSRMRRIRYSRGVMLLTLAPRRPIARLSRRRGG